MKILVQKFGFRLVLFNRLLLWQQGYSKKKGKVYPSEAPYRSRRPVGRVEV